MSLTILSYNLRHHVAYPELRSLAREQSPDIVCLQECEATALAKRIGRLHLVATSSVARENLAIFADTQRFIVQSSEAFFLTYSRYEQFRRLHRHRLAVVRLKDRRTGKIYIVGSLHATHLVATNALRRRQIDETLERLSTTEANAATIIVGDLNYPFFRSRLRRSVEAANAILHTPDKPTLRSMVVKGYTGYFDYMITRNATPLSQVTTLPFGLSDHAAIFARFM